MGVDILILVSVIKFLPKPQLFEVFRPPY